MNRTVHLSQFITNENARSSDRAFFLQTQKDKILNLFKKVLLVPFKILMWLFIVLIWLIIVAGLLIVFGLGCFLVLVILLP